MRPVWFNLRRFGKPLSRRNLVLIALLSLVWVAPALSQARSAVLSAHEVSIAEVSIAEGHDDFVTDAENGADNQIAQLEGSENPTTPPPEPSEWIAAWIDDLKQSSQRWIEVDLSAQQILAWEGSTLVFSAPVSTGREGDWTPPGVYAIEIKYDKAWMEGDDYDIPNVPYVMYFFGSYAIHGAYWRDSFGTPASRGCVSMSVEQAEWLYSWAAEGTHVVIER